MNLLLAARFYRRKGLLRGKFILKNCDLMPFAGDDYKAAFSCYCIFNFLTFGLFK